MAGCSNMITGKVVYAPEKSFQYKDMTEYKEIWFTIDNNNSFTECTATLETVKAGKVLNSSTIKITDIIPDQKVNGILHYWNVDGADHVIDYVCE